MPKRNLTKHIACCPTCTKWRNPKVRRAIKRAQRKAERRNLNGMND